MKRKTLLIYGALGGDAVMAHVGNWKGVEVVEMDALLPDEALRQGAVRLNAGKLMDHARAADIERRVNLLIGEFLERDLPSSDVEVSRDFRAAGISVESFMMLSPYLYNLDLARCLGEAGSWDCILVSPGGGISLPAWRQFAAVRDIPLKILPEAKSKPSFLWMIKRRWQKRKAALLGKQATKQREMQHCDEQSQWLCADPRLFSLLSQDGDYWARTPAWRDFEERELEVTRDSYSLWWSRWWQQWLKDHPDEDPLSERWILQDFGNYLSREVFPRYALLLRQARNALKELSPKCLMIGAMRGKPEIMWLLAAREKGIPTGAYTLDDSVDPHTSFRPDVIFCDDTRHRELALERGMKPEEIVMVRSHRAMHQLRSKPRLVETGMRAQILLADTFYSGWKLAALPSISLRAFQLAVDTARLIPEHNFIIKFHPLRERPIERLCWGGFHNLQLWLREQFFQKLNPPKNITLAAPETRMSELFEETHLLLNIQSYASFEAYALQIPVIHLAKPEDEPNAYARLLRMSAAQVVDTHNPLLLASAIRQNLHDENHIIRQTSLQREFLHGFYHHEGIALGEAVRKTINRSESR